MASNLNLKKESTKENIYVKNRRVILITAKVFTPLTLAHFFLFGSHARPFVGRVTGKTPPIRIMLSVRLKPQFLGTCLDLKRPYPKLLSKGAKDSLSCCF